MNYKINTSFQKDEIFFPEEYFLSQIDEQNITESERDILEKTELFRQELVDTMIKVKIDTKNIPDLHMSDIKKKIKELAKRHSLPKALIRNEFKEIRKHFTSHEEDGMLKIFF